MKDESIADAVIATDGQGRVSFMNAVADQFVIPRDAKPPLVGGISWDRRTEGSWSSSSSRPKRWNPWVGWPVGWPTISTIS